jgi:hypothetical protein
MGTESFASSAHSHVGSGRWIGYGRDAMDCIEKKVLLASQSALENISGKGNVPAI